MPKVTQSVSSKDEEACPSSGAAEFTLLAILLQGFSEISYLQKI